MYMAKKSHADQQAKTRFQLDEQESAMAAYESNLEQMKKEFQDKAWSKSKEDEEVLQTDGFLSERELNQLSLIDGMMNQSYKYLESIKYEMNNYFTEFDWVKVYGDLILDNDLDFNYLI